MFKKNCGKVTWQITITLPKNVTISHLFLEHFTISNKLLGFYISETLTAVGFDRYSTTGIKNSSILQENQL